MALPFHYLLLAQGKLLISAGFEALFLLNMPLQLRA